MPDTPTQPTSSNDSQKLAPTKATSAEQEEKLNSVVWILLFIGAAILDLFQAGIAVMTLGTLGTVANILIDIVVGLSLATFFFMKNMLDWKLGISLILGFAIDFFTLGIAPAWLLDILYAWIITDGASKAALAPVIGEAAQKAALAVVSRGKSLEQQAVLKQRSENLSSQNKKYMTDKWGRKGKKSPGPEITNQTPGQPSIPTQTDNSRPRGGGGGSQPIPETQKAAGENQPVQQGQGTTSDSGASKQTTASPEQKQAEKSQNSANDDDNSDGESSKKKDGDGQTQTPYQNPTGQNENSDDNGDSDDDWESAPSSSDGWQYSKDHKKRKNSAGKVQKQEGNKWVDEKPAASELGGKNQANASQNQSSSGASSGSPSGKSGRTNQPQNPPRYGMPEEDKHPFVEAADTALGIKKK